MSTKTCFIQIHAVFDCSMFSIGTLPFDIRKGTCKTFNRNSVPTIFLCFDFEEQNTCRALIPKNEKLSINVHNIEFSQEFEVNYLPNTTYNHSSTTIANYKGLLNFYSRSLIIQY